MAVPSCRYVNLSRSPSENRSNVDDADAAAVHIQLRTGDTDASANDEPHQTDPSEDNHAVLQPTPVCPGYIVVCPDMFGRIDPATGHFANTDSGVETDYSMRRPHHDGYASLALASGPNPENSDLAVTENSHRQPAKETVTVNDRAETDSTTRSPPSFENGVQGNGNTIDSAPVTNYAVIVGMDNGELDGTQRCSVDKNSVGQSHNVAGHEDDDERVTEELPASRSVSDEEQHDSPTVPFGISSPPVCYSLNSGGYLSHTELLGAAPAV